MYDIHWCKRNQPLRVLYSKSIAFFQFHNFTSTHWFPTLFMQEELYWILFFSSKVCEHKMWNYVAFSHASFKKYIYDTSCLHMGTINAFLKWEGKKIAENIRGFLIFNKAAYHDNTHWGLYGGERQTVCIYMYM